MSTARRVGGTIGAIGLSASGLVLIAPPAEAQQTVWGQACTVVLNIDDFTLQGGWTTIVPGGVIWAAADVVSSGSGFHPPTPAWPTITTEGTPGDVICVAGSANNCTSTGVLPQIVVSAGPNDDLIYGSVCQDFLSGNGGDDTIYGLGGDDFISGNAGDDSIGGGAGNDGLAGEEGDDTIHGNDGDDRIFGNDGADNLNGENGDDCIVGGEDDDEIYGWNGNDNLNGNDGNDYVAGNDGSDLVTGGFGRDTLRGNDGADNIWGDSAAAGTCASFFDGRNLSMLIDPDLIPNSSDETWSNGFVDWPIGASTGNYFDDDIRGGDSDDQLHGEAGNDTIFGDNGDDTIFGEGQTSRSQFFSGNLREPAYPEDRYYGAAGNDTISGNAGDDSIEGGGGNDRLSGNDGDDHLIGGSDTINTLGLPAGTDRLNGGTDWDACEPNTGFVDNCEIVL